MKPVLLGAYRLIAKLGRGRVTDVYLAAREGHTGKDELLVIKRLRSSDAARPEELQVGPDAELACFLHHPNIAAMHEVNRSGSAPYWVMDYVEGQPLDRVLATANRSGGLPLSFGLRILCDLLAALDYAHNLSDDAGKPLGIVHRDVRPHNLYISYQGELKLLDFGIPRPPVSSSDSNSSESGRAYIAPEQALSGSVDRRADVFAVGLVMWELLSRQRRATGDVPLTTIQGLQPELTSMQGSLDSEAGAELARINDRALEREPEKRYASAQEMRVELEEALGQLTDPRAATAAMARASLGSLMQRLFKNERSDATRRVQLLLAVDTLAGPERPADELFKVGSGTNGGPPPLRLSQPDEAPSNPSKRTTLPPLPVKSETAAAARESTDPQLPAAEARVPRSETTDPRVPRSGDPRFTPSSTIAARVERDQARPKPELRATEAIVAVLLVLAAVGLTWSFTRSDSKQETLSAATMAAPEPAATPVLRLCGSNTVGAELAPALVEGLFASKDSGAKVTHKKDIDSDVTQLVYRSGDKALSAEVTARGTATGFAGLAEGTCDVGMASRAISVDEAQRLVEKGLGDLTSPANEHVIALDGVAVVVHPNNALQALDRSALHDIFTGKASDWSEVGGAAGPIHVNARDDQSGTYDTFHHLVLGDDKLVSSAKRYARSDALADAVASDPAAIGFVGLAYVRTAKALAVGEAGAAPLLPTQFTVATEGYMLARRLYFYTPDKPSSPWVSELVSFAMSARGQEIAGKAGFVNLSLLTDNARCMGACPERYQAAIANAQRVSIDLRFRSKSDQPDSRARRDMDRLVVFLQNFREPKLLLLGFSDSTGGVSSNLRLSEERAKAIAHELVMRGIHASVVTGFGAEMPVATNDTESGRERNRRVEVWFEHL